MPKLMTISTLTAPSAPARRGVTRFANQATQAAPARSLRRSTASARTPRTETPVSREASSRRTERSSARESQTEAPLLPAVAAGDPLAVEACIDRYSPRVWSMARRVASDPGTAEDLVQDVFIRVWRSAERFDESKGSEIAFVTTIARRSMIDHLRRGQRSPALEDVEELSVGEADDALEAVDIRDEAAQAARALDQIRPEQSRVLRLSIYEGLSQSQIAEKLALPLGTVKSHMRRGLAKVAELLAESGIHGLEGATA